MKHLKKDTGGYALLYVLVIVMVLVAISMMICTVALRNLQSQQAAVERMADKYAAQGEIEKIKAIMEEGISGEYDNPAKAYLEAIDGKTATAVITFSPTAEDVTATKSEIVASIKSAEEDILVSAKVTINLTYDPHTYTDDAGNETKTYSIKSISTSFTFYTIETTGGDAG